MKLSALKVDSKAMEAGVWASPGEEYDDLQFKTRSLTDAYTDARAARMRRAALQYGGDQTKVPVSVSRAIVAECMLAHVTLDVRGLTDESGVPVSMDDCAKLMVNPDYPDVLTAAIKAAALVGTIRAADVVDATASLEVPSASA